VVSVTQPGDALSGLTAIEVASGKLKLLLSSKDALLSSPLWLPNGSGLIYLSSGEASNFTQRQIRYVSYPDGRNHHITTDTNGYIDLSIAGDSEPSCGTARICAGDPSGLFGQTLAVHRHDRWYWVLGSGYWTTPAPGGSVSGASTCL